jgi:signal transduction histidine kinase
MRVFKSSFPFIAIFLFASLVRPLAPAACCAGDALILPRDRGIAVSLHSFAGVYEDRSGQLGVGEIRQLEQDDPGTFRTPRQARRFAKYSSSAWWLRTVIENGTGGMQDLVLLAGPPNLELVDFYVRQQGVWRHSRAGSLVPSVAQQDLTRYPTLRFSLAPDESVQVLMRVKSHTPFRLNPVLYSQETFRMAKLATIVSDGMLIGGIGTLAVCAFLISILMRRLPFLWLSAIAAVAALREAAARAYLQRLFWPLDSTWGYRLELTLDTLCLALVAIFVYSVARRGTVPVPGMRVYAANAAILLACTVLAAFIPLSAATLLALIAAVCLAASMLASALLLARRSRLIAGLSGLSALLIVLDLAVKTINSPLGAPLSPPAMIMDSGMPFCELMISVANFVALALWAAHSLEKDAGAETLAVSDAKAKSTLDTAQIAGANSGARVQSAGEAPAGTAGEESGHKAKGMATAAMPAAEAANREAMILSYVGHDLRAPLATISGYTRLLRQAAPPSQHAYLDVIELSVGHQFSLIEELLAYSKLELQPFTIAPEEARLPALMEELARFGIALSAHNGNSFEYLPSATLPALVSLDRKRLRQAVLNLLGNAGKFTREGMVRLEARMDQGPGHSELHIHVVNDGPNIAAPDQQKIFSAFRQLRLRESGIGLGLFIVERIARGMGGDIRLESSPNAGNRFSLIVPVGVIDPTGVPTRAIRHTPARDAHAGHMDAPPLSARLALAKLARDGELSEIEKWVDETRLAHPHCVTFYDEVATCIDNFDMERLQRMALLGVA